MTDTPAFERAYAEPPRAAPVAREDHARRVAVPFGEPTDDASYRAGKLWETGRD